MPSGFIIAIDGPVAAGKGTIAPKLANELHGFYLYTGGTYRAVALIGIEKGIDLHNAQQVIALLPSIEIAIIDGRIIVNGADVTDRIKESDTANGSSVVGVIAEVRKAMVRVQQQIAGDAIEKGQIVILEGRDTATVVFPDAEVKIYLTASDEVRAKRRLSQYQLQGEKTDFAKVLEEIKKRDKRDTERDIDPLVKEPEKHGYLVVDNTDLSEEETVRVIIGELKKRKFI